MGWIVGLSIGWVTPKTIKLVGICCFSAEHAALRSKSKDWLARFQDNLSELSNISTDSWFSLSTLFSSTNKSDHHDMTEIVESAGVWNYHADSPDSYIEPAG